MQLTVFVGTSWKMTKTIAEAQAYADKLNAHIDWPHGVQPFIIPAHTLVDAVRTELHPSTGVWVGAQNAHWMPNGAFTGEVSMSMVKDAGATLVEIGHSERREHFHETDGIVNLKVRAALEAGLTPLVCVGESADVYEAGESVPFVVAQVDLALDGVADQERRQVMIAYEPVWSIGEEGIPASPEHVGFVASAIRERFEIRALLYGGSVTVDNAPLYLSVGAVDGIFVGRTAWEAESLLRLVVDAGRLAKTEAGERR
jgi:triosephosphate isomerase